MKKIEGRPRWNSGLVQYATSDTSKTLKAKSTIATDKLVVTKITVTGVTSAAQVVTIKDSGGTVTVARVGASLAANGQLQWNFESADGIALPANTDLVATSSAGPAIDIYAEGYIDTPTL